jgi:PAS domain S-box-containing protein
MHAPPTKVLIVEDEAIVAHDIEKRLRKAGYEVPAIAASGEQALQRIEQTSPDLVLMDINLQGPSDGIQVAAEVRNRYQLPVIFLTAYADKATLDRAKATEPFGYLAKPIGHVNLANTIEVALYNHRVEQELKNREAWLRTVLHSMADAVVVTDASGSIQFLNPSAEKLAGWAHGEAVGRQLSDVVRLVDFADRNLAAELNAAIGGGVATEFPRETRLISHQGQALTVEGQVAISQVEGRPSGTVVTFRDVTARNLEEVQIRQEQKMLVAGRLANGIARDFNRLLTVILRYSEQLLGEMDETSNFRPRVKAIHRAGSSAAVLTGQVLGLCRNKKTEPRALGLNSLINRFLPMLKRMAGSSIAVETRLEPQLGQIRGDLSQMEQLLVNLVVNARDAMPRGGKLTIQTGNIDLAPRSPLDTGSESFVRLAVEDNGAGMESDVAEHMFEPFFTTKKPGVGTGLGLAVVHAIVSAGDGLINVDSKPGAGTLVEIFLPRLKEEKASPR